MAARAVESTVLILVGWQADGYLDKLIVTNSAGSIKFWQTPSHTLHNLSPSPSATCLTNYFVILQAENRCQLAQASRDHPGFEWGRPLAGSLTAALAPQSYGCTIHRYRSHHVTQSFHCR